MANNILNRLIGPSSVLGALLDGDNVAFVTPTQCCFDAYRYSVDELEFRTKWRPPLIEVITLARTNRGSTFRLEWNDPFGGSTAGYMEVEYAELDSEPADSDRWIELEQVEDAARKADTNMCQVYSVKWDHVLVGGTAGRMEIQFDRAISY